MKFYSGIKDSNKIALTFDDGPNPTITPLILDILKEKGVKATFFLLGKRVEQFPAVAERIRDEGHCVGNHTYSHINDFDKCQEVINTKLNIKCALFKPPSNALSNCIGSEVIKSQYSKIINFCPMLGPCVKDCAARDEKQFHLDSSDWNFDVQHQCPHAKKTDIFERIKNIQSGAIIQLHDGSEHDDNHLWKLRAIPTLLALPDIIGKIYEVGCKTVNLADVFEFYEHTCTAVDLDS